jgi:hypothetical protein
LRLRADPMISFAISELRSDSAPFHSQKPLPDCRSNGEHARTRDSRNLFSGRRSGSSIGRQMVPIIVFSRFFPFSFCATSHITMVTMKNSRTSNIKTTATPCRRGDHTRNTRRRPTTVSKTIIIRTKTTTTLPLATKVRRTSSSINHSNYYQESIVVHQKKTTFHNIKCLLLPNLPLSSPLVLQFDAGVLSYCYSICQKGEGRSMTGSDVMVGLAFIVSRR